MYKQIKQLREAHNLSQQNVADLLDLSQTAYSRYENGTLDIPTAILIKLAAFYKTSVDDLLGLTSDSSIH